MKEKLVVAYCRISKDRDGNELGVKRQEDEIIAMALRLGLTIVRWFVDNDISAFDTKKVRPAFQELLGLVEEGLVGTVLVYHNDRLIRQPSELEDWILADKDTSVLSAMSGRYDLSTPDGRALARILGAIAAKDSEHQSARIKLKKTELALAGKKLGGGRPFGYTKDGMSKDPREARLIKKATTDILQGGSLRGVALEWRAKGIVGSQGGKEMHPSIIKKILLRPRNAGLMQLRGEIIGLAGWPAIVTVEDFNALRLTLTDPQRRTNAGSVPRWLGSGVYLCGTEGCGHTVTAAAVGSKGRTHPRSYVCRARRAGIAKTVPGRHVSRQCEPVDDLITELIVTYLSDRETVDALSETARPAVEVEDLKAELASIEANQKLLVDNMLNGGWSMEMVNQANDGLATRRSQIEMELAATISTSAASMMGRSESVPEAWARSSIDTRQMVVKELMTVTILGAPSGAVGGRQTMKGERLFDPQYIKVDWKHAA